MWERNISFAVLRGMFYALLVTSCLRLGLTIRRLGLQSMLKLIVLAIIAVS